MSTAKDLGRLREIASVLVRHGLGDVVRRLGMARLFERTGRALHWKVEGLTKEPAVRVREALEELGPTFVKVGQILAGRSDLLPASWTSELAKLQDHAAAVPFEDVEAQLVEDLGDPPSAVFAEFRSTPLAAASIAQVYAASLADGTPVVLKVRRPGIREAVEADLRLLSRLADQAEAHLPEVRRYRPRSLVRQFARSIRAELDLRVEARNAERIRQGAEGDVRVVIPRIHSRWTTERLCVMDHLPGQSVRSWVREGKPEGVVPEEVARVGAEFVLRTIFVDGCFHADPHPGNVFLLPDGRIGLVDFGMVGVLSESRRLEFLDLLFACVERRSDEAVEILLRWGDGSRSTDVGLLRQDCEAFIDRYRDASLRELDGSEVLGDLTALLRENDLFLPSDVALLLKVFFTLDGLGTLLDPGFVILPHVEPFARDAWTREHSPAALLGRGSKRLGTLLRLLPRDLSDLAQRVRRGQFRLKVGVDELERFGETIDRSANRLTVGLVTSALIVGTSISLSVGSGPRFWGVPLFALLGFMSSLAAGVVLLWSILHSRNT